MLYISRNLVLAGLLLLMGCDNDSENNPNQSDPASDPTDDLTLIATQSHTGGAIELYADGGLVTGWNRLFFKAVNADGNTDVSFDGLTTSPMMDMGEMIHTTPHWEPAPMDIAPGIFTQEIVFIMSSEMGTWNLTVTPSFEGVEASAVEFNDLAVAMSPWLKNFTVTVDSIDQIYYVTLNGLENPQVGSNPVTFTLSTRESMMNFPILADYGLEFEPWMPSMEHGSTGNEQPTHTWSGHYDGSVVFSMTGDWEVRVTISDPDNTQLGEVTFSLEF